MTVSFKYFGFIKAAIQPINLIINQRVQKMKFFALVSMIAVASSTRLHQESAQTLVGQSEMTTTAAAQLDDEYNRPFYKYKKNKSKKA